MANEEEPRGSGKGGREGDNEEEEIGFDEEKEDGEEGSGGGGQIIAVGSSGDQVISHPEV